jgi:spermidine synthase
MQYFSIPIILIIGASGLVAQIIVLRELLVNFYGNELTLGVILANWMLLEACGVYLAGRLVDRVKDKVGLFMILQLVFVFGFYASIYAARTFKALSGAFFGQGLSLGMIYLCSFLVMLPIGFCHGALFSVSCGIFQKGSKEPFFNIGRVYTWETAGSILGGIILTYILIPLFNSFELARIIGLLNLAFCLVLLKSITKPIYKRLSGLILLICLGLLLWISPQQLQENSLSLQYKKSRVIDYRNSFYGNIVVTAEPGQETLFYNGIPSVSIPYPDISSIEEFGNLPLLFSPHPRKVLLVGYGLGGLVGEILKHPLQKLDYLEIDPQILNALKTVDHDYFSREAGDRRLKVINQDSRVFLQNTKERYDLVLLGPVGPADLVSNRLFTEEFFSLAKSHLEKGGILAFRLSGSLSYLSKQLSDLNFSIINGLKSQFSEVRVLPGDTNLVMGSDSAEIATIDAKIINLRLQKLGLPTNLLVPSYLDLRFDRQWTEWFNISTAKATAKINRDFSPVALFYSVLIWGRQFSPVSAKVFEKLADFNLYYAGAFLTAVFLILLFSLKRSKKSAGNIALVYAVASTGFFGMMCNLELVFGFQVFFGYIYKILGLLIAVFMSGIALGSAAMSAKFWRRRSGLTDLLRIEVLTVIFPLFLSLAIIRGISYSLTGLIFFFFIFLSCGFLLGAEFVLCAKVYRQQGGMLGFTSGNLYGADLVGGCLAGFIGGIWLLPVLGIWGCGLFLALLKATSFALLKELTS